MTVDRIFRGSCVPKHSDAYNPKTSLDEDKSLRQNSSLGDVSFAFVIVASFHKLDLIQGRTYCSTYHFYFIRGMRPPPSCLSLKVNAIRNINSTLQNPDSIPNDYSMVAVAVMTLLEVSLLLRRRHFALGN
jgi:hypothetical protein